MDWWHIVGLILTGGIGRELVIRLLPSKDKQLDAEDNFRTALLARIGQLEGRVDAQAKELADSREKYEKLLEKHGSLQEAHNQVTREMETMRQQLESGMCDDCPLERKELATARRWVRG